jgi:thioredoxin-related protein
MKKNILLLVFSLISIFVFSQVNPEPPYKRFPTHPPLKLLLTDSATIFTDKELKKEKPLFFILFSPDCDHCQKETEELINMIDSFKNIQIVMATTLSFEKMKWFYNQYQLNRFANITVGHDIDRILPTYYRISSMPFLAFYNKKGKLIEGIQGALPLHKVLEYFRE